TFPGFEVLRWAAADGVAPSMHLPGALVACDRPDLVDAEIRLAHEEFAAEWTEDLRPFLPGPDEVLRAQDEVLAEVVAASLAVLDIASPGRGEKGSLDL